MLRPATYLLPACCLPAPCLLLLLLPCLVPAPRLLPHCVLSICFVCSACLPACLRHPSLPVPHLLQLPVTRVEAASATASGSIVSLLDFACIRTSFGRWRRRCCCCCCYCCNTSSVACGMWHCHPRSSSSRHVKPFFIAASDCASPCACYKAHISVHPWHTIPLPPLHCLRPCQLHPLLVRAFRFIALGHFCIFEASSLIAFVRVS